MACDPQTLVTDAKYLIAGMSDHDLLAYIAWQLATNAGITPTPATLMANAKFLREGMGQAELLASIAYSQCVLAGG